MAQRAKSVGRNALRVVVAEDSPTQAAWIEHALSVQGCTVTVARDGEAALIAVRAIQPDILVSDVNMPKMDGYELCRAVKSESATAETRVVLATSLAEPIDVLRGLAAGADDFLGKPYSLEDLYSRMAGHRISTSPSGAVILNYHEEEARFEGSMASTINFMVSAIEEAAKRNSLLSAAREQMRDALAAVVELQAGLRDFLEASAQAMCVVARDGTVRYSNESALALFGEHAAERLCPTIPLAVTAEPIELSLEALDGGARRCEVRVTKTIWEGEECFLASFWDVTESAQRREELLLASLTDELTGLFNRRGFDVLTAEQARLAHRQGPNGKGTVLLYADLDGMKTINDEYGHAAGDAALVEVARIIRHVCREVDIPARMGGDEFAVLLVDCAPGGEAAVLSRLDECIRQANELSEAGYEIALSVGAVRAPSSGDWVVEDLVREADEQMYVAKSTRKGSARR